MFQIQNRRYLGSKTKLLSLIDEIVDNHCPNSKSFADPFGGTGVVSAHFAGRFSVHINDLLQSNYVIYKAFLSSKSFNEKKLMKLLKSFNLLVPACLSDNYYSINFKSTYLSEDNLKIAGFVREEIDRLYVSNEINEREKAILLTSAIYAIDRIANTVGHYDAYRKGNAQTKKIYFDYPCLSQQDLKTTNICNMDANIFIKNIKADIVYLDPPYNSRQYCDAYHFLENFVQNKKPPVFGVAKKMDRSNLKSNYCTKRAAIAFKELIEDIEAKYILVSYNNTGNKINARSNARISDTELLAILKEKGEVKVFEQDFSAFNTGKTEIQNHKERIFLCTVGRFKNSISKQIQNERILHSPLNYTGGKHRLLPQLLKFFPKNIENFYDVFCGGANVAINVNAKSITAIDHIAPLIELLQYLKKNPSSSVLSSLENLISQYGLSDTFRNGYSYYGYESTSGIGQYNKEKYMALRRQYNASPSPELFLLLIIFGFNNQIRFNKNNQFNLPVGKRDFNSVLRKKLFLFCQRLKEINIDFQAKDFRSLDIDALKRENAFLYLDPPYYLGTATYNENNGWTKKDELDMYYLLESCNSHGIKFALSNNLHMKGREHTLLKEWVQKNNFIINEINGSYSNSNYHRVKENHQSREVLITNY